LGGGAISFPAPAASFALLVFFKTSCPTCRWALPFFENLHRSSKSDVLQVIAVAEDEESDVVSLANELGLTFPIALEPAPYETSAAYGLTTVPTLFLVRKDGVVELSSAGFARDEILEMISCAAARAGAKPISPFPEGAEIPAFRPG
jgi:thiol-disulfide isomerase/thioredoxin